MADPSPRRGLIVAAVVAAGAGLIAALVLQGPRTANSVPTVREVSERTMSPFCDGLTLEECPTTQSAELRGKIGERVTGGQTNRQINEWLVEEYGEVVLGSPRLASSWLIPAAVVLVGFITLGAALLLRRSPGSIDSEGPPPQPTVAEHARVAAELQHFAGGTGD